MKSIKLILILFIVIAGSPYNLFAQSNGFDHLFANEIEEAKVVFQKYDSESALQGMLLAAWSRGDSPAMADNLKQLIAHYTNSPYISAYLSFLAMPEMQGWKLQDRVALLNEAYDNAESSAVRQVISAELSETLDMLLDQNVEQASRNAGAILDHWKILGPFGRHGASDLMTRFSPENEIKQSYPGWLREAVYHDYNPIDLTGMVELGGFMGPTTGVGYLFNVINTKSDGEMWLTIQSPSDYRVWWNGQPVMEKSIHKLHTAQSHSVLVPIKSGTNVITVKSQKSGDWWVRAFLQDQKGETVSWQSADFQPAEHQSLYLKPFADEQYTNTECRGLVSDYPFEFDSSEQDNAVVHKLLQSVWYAGRSQTDAARRLVAQTIDEVSTFSLLHTFFGEQSLRLALQRQGSKSRFQQEAESALQTALKLDPLSRNALLGLQSYYMDRDQIDTSLDLINNHIEEHPEILSTGYTGMVDYALGILYDRKGFNTEAKNKFKKVLGDYLPSYEAYRHLANYYEQRNQIQKTIDMIERGLSIFPSNPTYMNYALSLRSQTDSGPDPLALYDKALAIHPHTLHFIMSKTVALERNDQFDGAISYLEKQKQRYPHMFEWEQKQAQLAFHQGDRKKALDVYRSLYQAKPIRSDAFHVMRDVAHRPDFPYMTYDKTLDDINLQDAMLWENSRANSIYLLDIMVQEYYEDGTYSQYIHQAVKVLNQKGIDQWAETVIPNGVELIMARTITPAGIEWPVNHVQNLNNQQALSMYGVEPGSIVEYAYLMRAGRDDPGMNVHNGGYFFGAENDPMLHSELTIIVPDSLPFHYASEDKDFVPEIQELEGKKVYQWLNENQDGLKSEAFSPPLSRRVPTVHWTTVSDFNTLLARHSFSVWGYEEESPIVDAKATELMAESEPGENYVETVFTWIRDTINESSGGFTTADTVALQTGGQFQKLRLAKQLLAKAGIQSHLAVAFPWENRDGYGPLPDINLAGVSVLIVPKQKLINERLVLEFTSQYVPFGQVDPALRNLMALVYDANPAYLEPVDPSIWAVGIIDKYAELEIKDDNSAQINGFYAYHNSFDRQIRQAITNPEVRQRIADQQLANDFRGIQIEKHELVNVDDFSKIPRLEYSGLIPDLISQKDTGLSFKPIIDKVGASNFITGSDRESLMIFNSPPVMAPLKLKYDCSLFLENGQQIIVPDDKLLLSEFGAYLLTFDWQNTDLVVRRSFILYENTIKPESYLDFVEFCRNIDEIEEADVLIY